MNEDFESYSIEDEEEEEVAKTYTLWKIVPRIMVTPSAGWELAKRHAPAPELATIRFFLPLCILSGASVFLSALYPAGRNGIAAEGNFLTVLLVNAVIQFCSFFLGYYLSLVLAKAFLPKDVRYLPSTSYGKIMVMTGTATLAFFHILYEGLLMFDFILVFLPLWTIFIIFRGMEHSGARSDKWILAIGVMCLVIIISPTLIEWVLALFV